MTNCSYEIRMMGTDSGGIGAAMELVWRVFAEFEALEYSDEGIAEFQSFIKPDAVRLRLKQNAFCLWGAYEGDTIVGVIASRLPCHIALLFVEKTYHRRGIAKALYQAVLDYYGEEVEMTVNSSPYALEAYRHLGFVETDTEQVVNGLRFIPMKRGWGYGSCGNS